MKLRVKLRSGLAFRYPNSGVVFGQLIDAMRLKHVMYEGKIEKTEYCSDVSAYKRMQSWFSGERILPEYVGEYLKSFVERCIPAAVCGTEPAQSARTAHLVIALIQRESVRWDHMTMRLNSIHYADEQVGDAVYAALRLYALDIGIRLGALLRRRETQNGSEPKWDTLRTDDQALKFWISWRCKALDGLPLEKLRAECGISETALADWRAGRGLPTPNNLVILARMLTLPGERADQVEFELRLLVGALDLRRRLTALVERPMSGLGAADLFDGVLSVAQYSYAFFKLPPYRPLESLEIEVAARQLQLEKQLAAAHPAVLTDVIWHGSASDSGKDFAHFMASITERHRPQLALDFKAMTQDWRTRIGFCDSISAALA